ncbi:hypothetical protein HMPREF1529_01308 [Microbacterium sp. oral taxon 186 str. F0373]|uniref:alpha-L-arabinofuranosidase C-terminal domain-containing protein n=1 Tax=Microbacterium sp. oral taxon 186 TaxID=712383 RepID=UPI000258860C|nr:alpha-L-arabinofuranosidase C-terminal domain-containing protein [Microbacterium sp. oral taxon 186]EIC09340.1 alpha-L-arabinofuranosidase domain protein [Microbacterium laevaniformans OR221]EPD84705.1 hypothetical protein HMPREF1529_01308 [Microbacterium sp. oral taxon 186 str. F0373]
MQHRRPEPGGPARRQTTFYPFSLTSRLGRGTARRVEIDGAPRVQSARFGDVSAVNAVATTDDAGTSVFFVNRSVSDAAELVIDLRELDAASLAVVESWMITDADYRVRPQSLEVIRHGDELRVSLPAVSWAVIRLTA